MFAAKHAVPLLLSASLALLGCGQDAGSADTEASLPSAPVRIVIDEMGIPHVYAESDEDLFYGYGYQIASDRLLQLEMFRRFALGRLSEALGAGGPGSVGQDSLTDDRFARIFDWKRWGRSDAEWMRQHEPEHYELTSAWVSGINARIDEVRAGRAPLPFGFAELDLEPSRWSPDDVYVVQKMAGFGLDQTIQFEVFVTFVKQFAPTVLDSIELFAPARPTFSLPEDDRPQGTESRRERAADGHEWACYDPAEAGAQLKPALDGLFRLNHLRALGSNNWALDGRHTSTGMPILAGDPHLGYAFSGISYAIHLDSQRGGGTFNAAGFSFVGAPGIFAGHNDAVAWTETSSFADVMDMWAVEVVDGKARLGDDWVDTVEREEVIDIKGGEPDVITVVDVPGYGVIMPSSLVGSPLPIAGAGKEVLVGWTGFSQRPARYFRELMRVRSLDEFDAAVLRMPEMSYNFVAADASGIAYRVGVEVPARNSPAPGREPWWTMDAADPSSLWPQGARLSEEQRPHSRAEERGWIVTANNDPFGFTANGRLDDDPWYYGALFPPGWRASRIESELQRLIAQGKVSVEDMQALQMDVRSNLADDLVPVIAEVWEQAVADPELSELASRPEIQSLVQLITVDWDRRMTRDSSAAVAFHAFAHLVTRGVIEDDISPVLFGVVLDAAPMYLLKIATMALQGRYGGGDEVMQQGRGRIVLEALGATADWLEGRFGSVEAGAYVFADVRSSSMAQGYGRGMDLFELPTDGGESTVNVAQSKFLQDGMIRDRWVSQWGPIERQVTSFRADGAPEAYANFALGNVADTASPHFDDAMSDWVEGRYRKILFDGDEVEAAAEREIELAAAR